ncbi:hypothetical protein GCM10023149_38120 [Mucilaginibacter gynuensis]|uniref:Carboxypeptidase-like regulatory domain-containing protein n=1 Tax=Mucilaginibacter gynuensis TaxID=1302236 RepID=A0ABP8GZ84_9SPHI
MKPYLTIFLFILSAACFAQHKITGTVYDADDKKPLPNATVFLNNTTNGTQTNNEGTYSVNNVKPGQYELIVSMVGYEPYRYSVKVYNDIKIPAIYLKSKTTSLSGVKIKAREISKKDIRAFKDELIGRSRFAKQCEIINPKIIDINYNAADKLLTASTSDFLIVENKALGYRIKYLVNEFTRDEKKLYVAYEGYIQFEPMTGDAIQQQRWRRNRMEAYEGSSQHFLRSVLANDTEQQGFKIFELSPNYKRPSDTVINAMLKKYSDRAQFGSAAFRPNDSLAYWRDIQNLPKLLYYWSCELHDRNFIYTTDQRSLYAMSYPATMFITYKNKKSNKTPNSSFNLVAVNQPNSLGQWDTIVYLNELYAFFDINGVFVNPAAIKMEGYWGKQRLADLLPIDFEPGTDAL